MNNLVRSALAGAATGGRTMTGLAVLTATTPPDAQAQPDATLRKPAAAVTIALLAATELVLDKLPQTPSRLDPPGLVGRLVVAAGCGVVIARRAWRRPDQPTVPGEPVDDTAPSTDPVAIAASSVTATAVAAGTAYLGVLCRDIAGRKLGPDWVGAVLEDAVVVGLATVATR